MHGLGLVIMRIVLIIVHDGVGMMGKLEFSMVAHMLAQAQTCSILYNNSRPVLLPCA